MGILTRAFSRKTLDVWDLIDRSSLSTAGVSVTEQSALRFSAVWACIHVISEDVATLPLFVYERLDRGKRRVPEHPLHSIMHDQANPEMTALQFRETLTAHVLGWGNGYAYIVRDDRGTPVELWPLLPDRTFPRRDDRTKALYYETRVPNIDKSVRLQPDQVFHLAGLGFDGLTGYSPIALHRQAIGLGLAAEEFGARFFGQGTNLGGVIEHPAALSQPAYERLQASATEKFAGLGRSHLLMILEEGAKLNKLTIPPDEAQFIETRKFQITDIARIYRVPPHKIADLDRATFSNIEEQAIDYVVSTLRPWLVRWEQTGKMKLLPQRTKFFMEHSVEGLLRGNIVARYQAYAVGIQNRFLTRNEVRELENRNPVEGGDEMPPTAVVQDAPEERPSSNGTDDEQVRKIAEMLKRESEVSADAAPAS